MCLNSSGSQKWPPVPCFATKYGVINPVAVSGYTFRMGWQRFFNPAWGMEIRASKSSSPKFVTGCDPMGSLFWSLNLGKPTRRQLMWLCLKMGFALGDTLLSDKPIFFLSNSMLLMPFWCLFDVLAVVNCIFIASGPKIKPKPSKNCHKILSKSSSAHPQIILKSSFLFPFACAMVESGPVRRWRMLQQRRRQPGAPSDCDLRSFWSSSRRSPEFTALPGKEKPGIKWYNIYL